MKKQYILKIFNIILIAVLMTGFTFAWMTDELVKYGRFAKLKYEENQLFIMANDLSASLYIKVREGSADDASTYDDYSDRMGKDIFVAKNFAPGDYIQYKLVITNRSKIKTITQIVFGGITTDSPEISEKLIFGTTKFENFWQGEEPNHVVLTVADKLVNGAFTFFERLEIPPVQANESRNFEIYWYVFFDRTATNESAAKYFKIPHMYIISI